MLNWNEYRKELSTRIGEIAKLSPDTLAGYKALSVDYDEDGHVFDATLKGPVLGLTWRF